MLPPRRVVSGSSVILAALSLILPKQCLLVKLLLAHRLVLPVRKRVDPRVLEFSDSIHPRNYSLSGRVCSLNHLLIEGAFIFPSAAIMPVGRSF